MPTVVLLGPQRREPTLVRAVDTYGGIGAVAAVTAGWEEREEEIEELSDHLSRPVSNLTLHARAMDVFRRDRTLHKGWNEFLESRQRLHDAYRLRLSHALDAVRDLRQAAIDEDLRAAEVEAALVSVRALDAHVRERGRRLRAGFDAAYDPAGRASVAEHRAEVSRLVESSDALLVAGGHVGILLDLLRLFDVAGTVVDRPVFAWSAGAMAVSEQVVLFHDRPPQGAGHAEVFEDGLALAWGVLPLPHAKHRLDLDDVERVSTLARRFSPLRPMAMDGSGARLVVGPAGALVVLTAVRELTEGGSVVEHAAA